MTTKTTVVLGIGNTLLSDEGVGVYAIRHMQTQYPSVTDIEYLDGGTLSFTLVPPIEDADRLIVIDATQLNAEPGTICLFENDAMDDFLGSNKKSSVHEVGLLDLMSVACLTGSLPEQRALIGIQPALVDWGDEPTAAVQQAIPEACELAMQLVERWRQ